LPTYAYRCAECGHRFETVQSFTDEALTVCPVCNGVLRKVFNAVGVVFKGSGFYRTDSRAAALAASGNGSESKSSDAKNGESTTSDSKNGEAKTEAKTSGANGSGNGTSSSSNGSPSNGSSSNGSSSKSSDSSGSKTPTG
jgi:putative FmdB family regulatory protein